MKTKEIEKKLELNKITITTLSQVKMSEVNGGCPPPSEKRGYSCVEDTFTVM